MKEYPHAFNAQISNGLALIQEDSKHVEYLAECIGFRPSAYGLALHEPIQYIAPAIITETTGEPGTPGAPFVFPPVEHSNPEYWYLSPGSYFEGTILVAGGQTLTDSGRAYGRFIQIGAYIYAEPLTAQQLTYTFSATPVWWHPDLNFSVSVKYYDASGFPVKAGAFATRNLVPGVPFSNVLHLTVPAGTTMIWLVYELGEVPNTFAVVHEGPIMYINPSSFITVGTEGSGTEDGTLIATGLDGQLFVDPEDIVYGVLKDSGTGAQKLYSVTNLSSLTEVPTVDPETGEGNALPPFSRKLNFVSLHKMWFACNQEGTICNPGSKFAASNAVRVNAICRWKDRLIFGGLTLSADHLASESWEKLWTAWMTVRGPGDEGLSSPAFDDSHIFWTQEGGLSTGTNLVPELGVLGLLSATQVEYFLPAIIEGIRAGRMGFLRIRDVGTVLGLAVVGEQILVAGERSTVLLSPEEVPGLEVSLRQRKFGNTGIASPQGIYSDSAGALLVSENLVVHRVTGEGVELVGQLTLPSEDYEFIPAGIFPEYKYGGYYIHDNRYCYYIVGDKASMTGSIISSAIVAPTGDYHYIRRYCPAVVQTDIDAAHTYCRLKTNKSDFDLPALKTLRWVTIAYAGFEYAQARLHVWYNHMQNAPTVTPWILVNKEGATYFGVTGLYFQIEVRYVKEMNGSIPDRKHIATSLSGSWQLCDNRYIRGMYGNAAQIASNPDQ